MSASPGHSASRPCRRRAAAVPPLCRANCQACAMLKQGLGEVTMPVWGYGLLGPVEVRVDGYAVELAGAKQRLMLTMLLLAASRMVPADRLVDELWGEALSQDPAGALRTQVSRLRRALGPAGDSLITVEGGYQLHVERGQLDATRFEDALAAA